MKKLLLLPTLLLALNLGAATEQNNEPQSDTQTAETNTAQTKTEKKEPSFLARHADKLKKFAYITDVALVIDIISIAACIGIVTIIPIEVSCGTIKPKNPNLNAVYNSTRQAIMPLLYIGLGTVIAKLISDPITRNAMNKKHAFEIETLKQELATQQAKTNAA